MLPVDLLLVELPLFEEELFPFSLELLVVAMLCKFSLTSVLVTYTSKSCLFSSKFHKKTYRQQVVDLQLFNFKLNNYLILVYFIV